jgi:hypothetical protein
VERLTGGGRSPKNGTWFELAVASLLQTQSWSFGERQLDLRSFRFDVNPPTFSGALTQAGYGTSTDIIAQEGDVRYNISCKFSQKEDSLLRLRSKTFLSVFLEFLPLLLASRDLGQRMEFVLATNMRFAEDISQLFRYGQSKLVQTLVIATRNLGSTQFGVEFNRELFSSSTMDNLVRKIVPLKVTIGELEHLYSQNEAYRRAFENFSKSLVRTPKVGLNLFNLTKPDVWVNCLSTESTNHGTCTEVTIDNTLCHIGNIENIRRVLISQAKALSKSSDSILIVEAEQVFERNVPAFQSQNHSELKTCSILTRGFNDRKIVALPEHIAVLVMAGTRNVLVLNGDMLAPRIKKTCDEMFRFHPNLIPEIQSLDLGEETLREITKMSLSVGIGLVVPDRDIITND